LEISVKVNVGENGEDKIITDGINQINNILEKVFVQNVDNKEKIIWFLKSYSKMLRVEIKVNKLDKRAI